MIELSTAVLGVVASVVLAWLAASFACRRDRERLREDLKLDYSIENAGRLLLSNPNYQKRRFKKIRHHLRGFETDDELRRALFRAGAVVFRVRELTKCGA